MDKKFVCGLLAVGLGSMVFSDVVLAAATTGMPWEAPMDKVVRSITGPVAKSAGVMALTGTGLAWALGAGGEIVQKSAKVGTGLAVAFNATSHMLPMLGFVKGLLI